MMKAENRDETGFGQRDSEEREGYGKAPSADGREAEEKNGVGMSLFERILSRGNLNSAYKRVKANQGAPGVDGMTIEAALPWLKEHKEELLGSLREGSYTPCPVRGKEIPKPDGGTRKLGIPTVIDRIIQQAIAQKLQPRYEPHFSEGSYGYRPGKSAQQAMKAVKRYAQAGYIWTVQIDLSKYFDTLNHELLMNLLRERIQDKRTLELVKKYLKSGIMEKGSHPQNGRRNAARRALVAAAGKHLPERV